MARVKCWWASSPFNRTRAETRLVQLTVRGVCRACTVESLGKARRFSTTWTSRRRSEKCFLIGTSYNVTIRSAQKADPNCAAYCRLWVININTKWKVWNILWIPHEITKLYRSELESRRHIFEKYIRYKWYFETSNMTRGSSKTVQAKSTTLKLTRGAEKVCKIISFCSWQFLS